MASLVNIFMSMELFLKETEALIKSADLFVYTKSKGALRTILPFADWTKEGLPQVGSGWLDIFITSEPFDEVKYRGFYDDNFFMHVIEVKGGRSTNTELEKLGLRIVAKEPDKRIKAFMNKLQKFLKESESYGMGIGPGKYHGRIFYHRREIIGKTLWPDLERKIVPVNIPV
ncbi:hypothetical protein [Mucilaginibacter auburnensis]|uniref:Uncharacterized protein n=1 Tax=Mucilaginibacter auburnensis TaxID=1457233 RepID=A0A2H9VUE0_9SPHI|nr:hypothetical protein [Mucilaginibacter auburnensis]PJJ84437.1 hypothetical protein CLV57_1449 [Mucilaginibacter auburnensis]